MNSPRARSCSGSGARRAAPRGCTATWRRRRSATRGSARSTTSGTGSTCPPAGWRGSGCCSRARGRTRRPTAQRRAGFYADPETYFDYFTGLLTASPSIRLAADITPGYAGLSVERLASIRDGFVARGVRPAAVYLMRDPVERIWSAVRMDLQRRGEPDPAAAEERVRRMHKHEMYAARTRYDETLARLDEVFPAEDVFVGFYETLFDRDTLALAVRVPGHRLPRARLRPTGERLAQAGEPLPDDLVRTVATYFAPVYDAVAARFPDLDLAELWPSMR